MVLVDEARQGDKKENNQTRPELDPDIKNLSKPVNNSVSYTNTMPFSLGVRRGVNRKSFSLKTCNASTSSLMIILLPQL